ncbi:hypothetical protein [Microcoleus sp. S13_C5]|uniref:hypothetical protein n=1 Tax=Microcoleus sp. S13_C5 TaxID=3055411 RepID=UPI002FD022AC
MLVTKARRKKSEVQREEVRSPREKDHQARSPSTTLHLILMASQPYFSLCQFSS